METDFADPLAVQLGYHVVKLDTPEVLDWFEPTIAKQIHIELWYYIADRNGNRVDRTHNSEINCWEHFPISQWQLELELVRDKMKEWTNDRDREKAHGEADALLLHALEQIVTGIEDEDARDVVDEIIAAYQLIGKCDS